MQYNVRILLIALFLPALINAQGQTNIVAKGKLFWTFSSSDSVLTVTAEGVLPDFTSGPGFDLYRAKIKEVVIGEGTTRIGSHTAHGNLYPNIQKVTMPNTVTSIGKYALGNDEATTSITLSENLEEIGLYAIDCCVSEIRLPKSLQKIGRGAFSSYGSISFDKVHVEWDEPLAVEASNITTVQHIFYSYHIPPERTLYVPPGTEALYQAAPIWSEFTHILPEPGTQYTVTFDSQGGSEVAPLAGVEHGNTIAEPEAPTKENFIFSEWRSGSDSTKWDFAASTVVSDTTLYAKWDVATDINLPAVATTIILSGERIIIDGLNGVQLFSLSDLDGKLLIFCPVSNGSSISVAGLPQGWYIIHTGNETQRWQKK